MSPPKSTTAKQWAWFVGLWAAGVASVGAVSFVLRLWIGHQ